MLDEMLRTGKIQPSKSPAGAPILFVPKPHGRGLRLCIDDRGLNRVTILNRYPLLLMNELRDRVQGAKIFSKIDLKSDYNLSQIKEGNEWKSAFQTRYASGTLQNMINKILRDLIDQCVVIYIDNILIYLAEEKEHQCLVMEVLQCINQ
jgi:hypothetical protein